MDGNRILVVNADGRLEGIITETDLLRALRDHLGSPQTGGNDAHAETQSRGFLGSPQPGEEA